MYIYKLEVIEEGREADRQEGVPTCWLPLGLGPAEAGNQESSLGLRWKWRDPCTWTIPWPPRVRRGRKLETSTEPETEWCVLTRDTGGLSSRSNT